MVEPARQQGRVSADRTASGGPVAGTIFPGPGSAWRMPRRLLRPAGRSWRIAGRLSRTPRRLLRMPRRLWRTSARKFGASQRKFRRTERTLGEGGIAKATAGPAWPGPRSGTHRFCYSALVPDSRIVWYVVLMRPRSSPATDTSLLKLHLFLAKALICAHSATAGVFTNRRASCIIRPL